MKRIIFLVAALLTVFSGIAAVTAYEGHMVDVKAHVENALMVQTDDVNFGTMFPEQEKETQFQVSLSESFRAQTAISTINYKMYWEPKAIYGGALDPDGDGLFQAIWPYIAVSVNTQNYPISGYVQNANGTILIGADSVFLKGNQCDTIHLVFNAPVFDKWYNILTDPLTPSGILKNEAGKPAQYVVTSETSACDPTWTAPVPKTDLGNNFKIQVVGIVHE